VIEPTDISEFINKQSWGVIYEISISLSLTLSKLNLQLP
jgi:hypothetical protein